MRAVSWGCCMLLPTGLRGSIFVRIFRHPSRIAFLCTFSPLYFLAQAVFLRYNIGSNEYTEKPSDLNTLLETAEPLEPVSRAQLLEKTPALATAHREAASQGATEAPEASDDVDLHYVCFVRGDDGTLWELDGRRKGPLNRGQLESGEDVLSEKALTWGPRKFLEREGADLRFSAVALAGSLD